jgi:hypothetical protein
MVEERDTEQMEESGKQSQQTEQNQSDETPDESVPVTVGDSREKHVSIVTRVGEYHEHGNIYLKHSSVAFFVSSDASFPDTETTRYSKEDLSRVKVTQHHSMCFITTATAGEGPALDALRKFRDGSLSRSSSGRALVGVYYTVSPPIAATLSRHPDARTAQLVRWLVHRCATLARWRNHASRAMCAILTILLVALYILGIMCAAFGHIVIRLREHR